VGRIFDFSGPCNFSGPTVQLAILTTTSDQLIYT
jgi:hypothetical protein